MLRCSWGRNRRFLQDGVEYSVCVSWIANSQWWRGDCVWLCGLCVLYLFASSCWRYWKVCKMANKSGHQHADQFACQVFFNEQFASSFFYCLQLQYPNLSISSQGNQITKCSCFLPRDVFIWYSLFKRRMMWCWKTSNMVLLRPQVCDYISKDLSSIMKLVYHTNVALLPPATKST